MARTRTMLDVEGLRELDIALSEMKKSTARSLLLRNLKKAGQPIADDGEANAPKLSGQLAESYTVSTKLSRRQKKANAKESDVEVYIGPTPHPKSVQTEFGNAHQAAEPHLRPAWDGNVGANGGRVLKDFADLTADDIEKTRKRIARKAELLAAKMKA